MHGTNPPLLISFISCATLQVTPASPPPGAASLPPPSRSRRAASPRRGRSAIAPQPPKRKTDTASKDVDNADVPATGVHGEGDRSAARLEPGVMGGGAPAFAPLQRTDDVRACLPLHAVVLFVLPCVRCNSKSALTYIDFTDTATVSIA